MTAKILIIAPWIIKPDTAAGDVRFFAMLQILAKSNDVDFFMTRENHNAPELLRYKQNLQKIGVNILNNGAVGLELALMRHSYDIVLVEFWYCAAQCLNIIRRYQPSAQIVIDSVDIHFLREESGLAFGISKPLAVSADKRKEIATYQKADMVIVVTHEDRDALVAEKVTKPMILVPMIVPLAERKKKQRNQELLFVGGFHHMPNADGLSWFVRECWPAIRERVPAVTLTIVGSHPPPEVLEMDSKDGIKVAGFVPETIPYLDKAYLSIAPLRFGAGMKGKVTEAMAAGMPVVTTTIGAQGLNAVSEKHLMIGDEPVMFAENVVNLLSDLDLSERIGIAGQQHIRQLCSAEVVEKQLNDMVSELTKKIGSNHTQPTIQIRLANYGLLIGKAGLLCAKNATRTAVRKLRTAKHISNQTI